MHIMYIMKVVCMIAGCGYRESMYYSADCLKVGRCEQQKSSHTAALSIQVAVAYE